MKKKNRLFKLMSAALVIAAMTTCMLSGTLAKYTTQATASDNARVAQWGFSDQAIELDLFDDEYSNVKAADGSNVIAPGTTKTATVNFDYNDDGGKGAPEVAYEFKVEVAGECDDSIKANPSITFALDEQEGLSYDELLAAVKALSGDESGVKEYAPGELPEEFTAKKPHTIGWAWAFEGQDEADTAMGNAESLAEVSLGVTITATQID